MDSFVQNYHLPSNGSPTGPQGLAFCHTFKSSVISWSVFTMLSFVVGFPACVAILWYAFKTHSGGTPVTPHGFLMLNLCVMDLVFLLFIPPGLLNNLIWHTRAVEAAWKGIHALNSVGRPLMMACMCLDCYVAVVHPIVYRKNKSLTSRAAMAGLVWAVTAAYGGVYILSYEFYFSVFAVVPFVVAIVMIGVCDSFILYTLIKSHPGNNNIHPQKQRAVQTLTNSLVVSLLSYFPPVLMLLFRRFLARDIVYFTCAILIPLNVTATMGSAAMPMLYLENIGKLDRFKLGVAEILNSYRVRCGEREKK